MELYFEEGQVVTEELREKMLRAAGYAVETEDIFGLEPARCEISVSFVGPDEIQALNSEYRGIDRVTDVLSFPLFEDGEGGAEFEHMLGDIVLSLERCRAQAEEFGHSFERECAFLTVHSTLHLLGYDHVNSEAEDLDMRRRQTEIVNGMGLAVKEN